MLRLVARGICELVTSVCVAAVLSARRLGLGYGMQECIGIARVNQGPGCSVALSPEVQP